MSENLSRFLSTLSGWLTDAEVPYMVAGSFASTYHGHPRATQDVDIVIDPTRATLEAFLDSLPTERVYVDRQTVERWVDVLGVRDLWELVLVRNAP